MWENDSNLRQKTDKMFNFTEIGSKNVAIVVIVVLCQLVSSSLHGWITKDQELHLFTWEISKLQA